MCVLYYVRLVFLYHVFESGLYIGIGVAYIYVSYAGILMARIYVSCVGLTMVGWDMG